MTGTERAKCFRIEHNGSEWAGSFQDAVTAALRILSDGPLPVTFIVDVDDEPQRREEVAVGFDERWIYVSHPGKPIDRWRDLLGIEIG